MAHTRSFSLNTANIPKFNKTLISICFLTICNSAYSFEMPVNWTSWDNGAYVDHYKVYWGTSSGNYTNESGNIASDITSYTVQNLTDGQVYFFAVKAFDSAGNESLFSNEITNFTISSPSNNFVINKSDFVAYTFSGSAISNANIEIFIDGSQTPAAVIDAGNDGKWSVNLDFTNISEGSKTVTAVQNGGQSATISGIYDRTAPAAPFSLTIE